MARTHLPPLERLDAIARDVRVLKWMVGASALLTAASLWLVMVLVTRTP